MAQDAELDAIVQRAIAAFVRELETGPEGFATHTRIATSAMWTCPGFVDTLW